MCSHDNTCEVLWASCLPDRDLMEDWVRVYGCHGRLHMCPVSIRRTSATSDFCMTSIPAQIEGVELRYRDYIVAKPFITDLHQRLAIIVGHPRIRVLIDTSLCCEEEELP